MDELEYEVTRGTEHVWQRWK